MFALRLAGQSLRVSLHNNSSRFSNGSNQIRNAFRQSRRAALKKSVPTLVSSEGITLYQKLPQAIGYSIGASAAFFAGAIIYDYETYFLPRLRGRFMNYGQKWFSEPKNIFSVWWDSMNSGMRVYSIIFTANLLVALAWRLPQAQHILRKYFILNLVEKNVFPQMLLSTFSHQSLLHFSINMYCLLGFMQSSSQFFRPGELTALYLSGGLFSSMASIALKTYTRSARSSVGASGAILTVVCLFCLNVPDSKLALAFLPFFTIPAKTAIGCLMGFDLMGTILGWRILDHAAHLGGCLFGCLYYATYANVLREWKNLVIQSYTKIKPSKN